MSTSPRESNLSPTVCLACRQRKVRCDRSKPECGFCIRNGAECRYTLPQKAPGLRAGYVARLEKRIDDLEQEFLAFKTKVEASGYRAQNTRAVSEEDIASQSSDLVLPAAEAEIPFQDAPQVYQSELNYQNCAGLPTTLPRSLSQSTITECCNTWFEQYHSWFPILHRPTILESCQRYLHQPLAPFSTILKAIAVVVLPRRQQTDDMPSQLDEGEITALGNEIILVAIHNLSLETLQALLILSIAEYGGGRLSEFHNLISLCKRMSTRLGLRDLVAHNCVNYGLPSAIPPRMLPLPLTVIEREEKIRAFWATDALDSASTLGAAWHLSVSRPEPAGSLPCDDEIWRFPDSARGMYQFGNPDTPSSFSLFVSLVTNELWHVHNFLQRPYDRESAQEVQRRQADCDSVYHKLSAWHSGFNDLLAMHTPVYTDLFSASGSTPSQHPNSILIHCTIYSAIISLYQRFIFPISDNAEDSLPWTHAAERCLASCDGMADVARAASDALLETMNPHVIYCIFVAARFYVIYSRAVGLEVPNKLHLLVYALRVCGQRWPLASRLHKVLDVAVVEGMGRPTQGRELPREFYDLQYFSLDIDEALRKWVMAS